MLTSVKRQAAFALLLVLFIPIIAACGGAQPAATTPAAGGATAAATTPEPAEQATEAPATETEAPAETAEATPDAADATATAPAGTGAMTELPEVDPAAVTGDIAMAGSSTVGPLTTRMVERFQEDGYTGSAPVDVTGTGAGFERFCNGETDISNASRAIEDDEVQACQANGIEPLEFRVGTDALTVVVNPANDFISDITLEQLAQIFTGEVTTWDQLDSSYPAETIQVFSPGSDSGTFDYFVETILPDDWDADEDAAKAKVLGTPGIQLSENDNVLVQGVEGSEFAIGYFGYAFFAGEGDALKALSIEGIEPNAETAESGEYPIARPLFIYSAATIMEAKPQVADFINYYLTNVNDEILEVGYFPASEDATTEAKQNFLTAAGGQ
jgi:phosphate binding protein